MHGIDGSSRDKSDFIKRIVDAVARLPKKQSVIVGGGGGEEVFSLIKEALLKLGIFSCEKADFDVGTQGLVMIASDYFGGKIN